MVQDLLVIGTGISGLTFAIKVAEENSKCTITLISKNDINEGNTRYAQGGIAVVRNLKKDSTEKHIKDTLLAGDEGCDPDVVKFVVEEANLRLDELIKWGTAFDKKKEKLHLAMEGGHSENRIVHYKDQTGKQIQEVLTAKVKTFPNITILENHTLVDLITDHHSKTKGNRCYGAYVISQEEEKIIKISSKITVLSTGGAGSLYAYSTNPSIATGDGLGAAYRAKVQLEGLPFVQFHPTALRDKVNGNVFLITEAVRGAGGKLHNTQHEEFLLNEDPRGALAPRDIVARLRPLSKWVRSALPRVSRLMTSLDCSSASKGFKCANANSMRSIALPSSTFAILSAARRISGPSGMVSLLLWAALEKRPATLTRLQCSSIVYRSHA